MKPLRPNRLPKLCNMPYELFLKCTASNVGKIRDRANNTSNIVARIADRTRRKDVP